MPIGSVHKSSANIGVALDYDLAQGRFSRQEQAKTPEIVLSYNIYSRTPSEIRRELKEQAQENSRLKNKALRFSVNFDKNDKTPEYQRREFVKNVMREMGIRQDNHQAVVTKHNDKHPHYHILANRVGFDGKTLSDSHTKRRLELAIDKWEKRMNLDNSLSKSRAFVYDENSEKGYRTQKRQKLNEEKVLPRQKMPKKAYVQAEIKNALERCNCKTPEELKAELAKKGVEFSFRANKNGLAGTSFKYQKQAFKGAQIGYKANVLKSEFEKNQEKEPVRQQESSNKFKILPEINAQQMEFVQKIRASKQPRDTEKMQENSGFKEQERKVYDDIDNKIRENKNIHIHEVDDIIRQRMRAFKPNQNPWATAEKYGGEKWQYDVHRYAEKKQIEIEKNMKKEQEPQQFLGAQEEARKKEEREALKEQNQQPKYRGFRR